MQVPEVIVFGDFRKILANFISGGMISQSEKHVEIYRNMVAKWIDRYYNNVENLAFARAQAEEATHKAYKLQELLNRISAMETPNANSTVKRMANTAREIIE